MFYFQQFSQADPFEHHTGPGQSNHHSKSTASKLGCFSYKFLNSENYYCISVTFVMRIANYKLIMCCLGCPGGEGRKSPLAPHPPWPPGWLRPVKNSMFWDFFEKNRMFIDVFRQKLFSCPHLEIFCPPGKEKKSADTHVCCMIFPKIGKSYVFVVINEI